MTNQMTNDEFIAYLHAQVEETQRQAAEDIANGIEIVYADEELEPGTWDCMPWHHPGAVPARDRSDSAA
jgi:hypothetical protein